MAAMMVRVDAPLLRTSPGAVALAEVCQAVVTAPAAVAVSAAGAEQMAVAAREGDSYREPGTRMGRLAVQVGPGVAADWARRRAQCAWSTV